MSAVSVKLRPMGDRLVVKAIARETMTKSGIVLPDPRRLFCASCNARYPALRGPRVYH